MAYVAHTQNLYKDQTILMFKEVWATEKCHGTNAFVKWSSSDGLKFGSGGEKHDRFVKLFDQDILNQKFVEMGIPNDKTVTVYGEAAGGSQQGMSHTYGPNLFFIAFGVQIGNSWLDIPTADSVCKNLYIEFVPYKRVTTDLVVLDKERDADSEIAIRKGMGPGKKREGIVIYPLIELTKNNGERVMSKHKGDEFAETKTPRPVVDPSKMEVLNEANRIADEWVTLQRLTHVLQRIPDHNIEKMREIIVAMVEDVNREAFGEIVSSEAANKAISKKTAIMYKDYLKNSLYQNNG